jgi:hypothetical protein
MVVIVPSQYEGGAFKTTYRGEQRKFWRPQLSVPIYHYLAWYNDVACEIQPICSGVQVFQVYRLRVDGDKVQDIISARIQSQSAKALVKGCLQQWQEANTDPSPPYVLAYVLENNYAANELFLKAKLRGKDFSCAKVLYEVCEELNFRIFFAQAKKRYHSSIAYVPSKSKSGEFVLSESCHTSMTLYDFVSFDGKRLSGRIPIHEHEVVKRHHSR